MNIRETIAEKLRELADRVDREVPPLDVIQSLQTLCAWSEKRGLLDAARENYVSGWIRYDDPEAPGALLFNGEYEIAPEDAMPIALVLLAFAHRKGVLP